MSKTDNQLPELAIALILITRSLMDQPNFEKQKFLDDLKKYQSRETDDQSISYAVFEHLINPDNV